MTTRNVEALRLPVRRIFICAITILAQLIACQYFCHSRGTSVSPLLQVDREDASAASPNSRSG
jgi:hypothetical protein